MIRLINLVDRLDRVNFGIWNAAIATAGELAAAHGMVSEVWFPAATRQAKDADLNGARPRALTRLDRAGLAAVVREAELDPARDLIVSHGCWQYPTRWGRRLKALGYRWVAVPHGMLEPWSLSQKRLQKALYYALVEGPALRAADRVRAVGQPEYANLEGRFGGRLRWIPNGVPAVPDPRPKPPGLQVLFMARLHHKKGVIPLVEGWAASSLATRPDARLRIAGPDDGAFAPLQGFLQAHPELTNVTYLGAVYGEDKLRQLEDAHAYILPSFSEGFPTSVLEAMAHGQLPLISTGCNFPDALAQGIGIAVEPEAAAVTAGLEQLARLSPAEREARAVQARALIRDHYTYPILAAQQAELVRSLLP